jgi:putative IMPACT (imprinted ancient) family translation regulator
LQGHNLCHVLLTVVRYFGGTKLGIGGLIRAYSDAAKAAISQAQLVTRVPQIEFQLRYPYARTGEVMRVLQRHQVHIEGIDYGERTTLRAIVAVAQAAALQRELTDATSGQIEVELG